VSELTPATLESPEPQDDDLYVVYFLAGSSRERGRPMYLERIGGTNYTHSWSVHKSDGLRFNLEDAIAWVLTQPESEHAPSFIEAA